MLCSCQGKCRCFGINMYSLFITFLCRTRKWFNKLVSSSINRILLLEEGVKFIFRLLGAIFLHIDGILQDFGVVHRAPSDERSMVGKRWELILLNIAMNSLLNVKILAHYLYNLIYKIIARYYPLHQF